MWSREAKNGHESRNLNRRVYDLNPNWPAAIGVPVGDELQVASQLILDIGEPIDFAPVVV